MEYELTRSIRKTLSIHIKSDGSLDVRAPIFVSRARIEDFITSKRSWIEKHQNRIQNLSLKTPKKEYSESGIRAMKKRLLDYIEPRVRDIWSEFSLPKYTSIKITKSERRWGSCSAKNGLCFSYRLAEYLATPLSFSEGGSLANLQRDPPAEDDKKQVFIDAIIVHELAHLREKNHQKPFWNLVYQMMPEYESIMRSQRGID